MIVDGNAIAYELYKAVAAEVSKLPRIPVLAAVTCAPNFETKKYLELKKRKAAAVGITLRVIELPETMSTEEAIACLEAVLPEIDGLVVQLPFPVHVDREALLSAIPPSHDPDGFSYGVSEGACLPPVVAAIKVIATKHEVNFVGQNVVVLGQGRLVGKPAAYYLRNQGAVVTIITKENEADLSALKTADIIVSGMGTPHLITKEMVKEGVIIFDAGTSEDGGVMVGDIAPEVGSIASIYTPVPGGIGPITIAALLNNLVALIRQ